MSFERPPLSEVAHARAQAQRFIANDPTDPLSAILLTFLAATAPPTMAEAIPVIIRIANESGDWAPSGNDEQVAVETLMSRTRNRTGFRAMVWAQWATIVHFLGGVKP